LLLLLLGKGLWARTPLRLLVGDDISVIRLSLIGMSRGEALAIEGVQGGVGGIIGLGGIDRLEGERIIGDGRKGRLVWLVLGLKVGVIWIGPRLILRWGQGIERLTRV
jgi:hypothetical protein